MSNEKATPKPAKVKKAKTKETTKFLGNNGELHIIKRTIAPGNVQTYVVHTKLNPEKLTSKGKPKKERQKGASEFHKDDASAQAAIDKITAQAVKMGWTQKTKAAKVVKADAFDLAHLPSAASVNKK